MAVIGNKYGSGLILELIRYIMGKYNITEIYGHRELNSTDCLGNNFPLDRIRMEVRGEGLE